MKNSLPRFLGSVAVACLLICRPSLSEESPTDLAAADAAVRKADAEWAAAGPAGVDAWMAFYGADAIVLLPNDSLANGKELVRQSVARFLAPPNLSVAWHPIKVEMARSGELAYLIGAYELRFADPRGAPKSDRGRLIEIWKKQTDGSWKCIIDTWSSDEFAATPSNATTSQPAPAVPGSEAPAANKAAAPALHAQAPDPKYGAMPIHYEEAIRQYFQEHLKDPDSVQYQEISKPEQRYTKGITGNILMRETRNYGWIVKATINAKNSGGSYVGLKSYTFLFRGEKILHVLAPLTGDEIN